MVPRLATHRILGPEDLEPSDPRMKVVGVLNPGVAQLGETTWALVRVAEAPVEAEPGCVASPRFDPGRGLVIDQLPEAEYDLSDPRTLRRKSDSRLRLRFISHLRLLRSDDGLRFDPGERARLVPETPAETFGLEDPRITEIGGTFYITAVAVSPHGVTTGLWSTTDFERFHRHGTVFCPDNKDVVLFPEKILGGYVALHRPMPAMAFGTPHIWIARSPDLVHWGAHEPVLRGNDTFYRDRIGGGTPPLRTPEGWLTLYHGSDKRHGQSGAGVYSASALLLDAHNPRKVLRQSREPVMVPTEPFETRGFVPDVVFPTAVLERAGRYRVYYGAADQCVGVAEYDPAEPTAAG